MGRDGSGVAYLACRNGRGLRGWNYYKVSVVILVVERAWAGLCLVPELDGGETYAHYGG